MPSTPTLEPTGSPVRGAIPDPASSPGRRNPASTALAKLLSVIRGDKYLVDAYPPTWHDAGAVRDGDEVADERSAVALEPYAAERAAPVASQTKER
jgi:hypothetical protein